MHKRRPQHRRSIYIPHEERRIRWPQSGDREKKMMQKYIAGHRATILPRVRDKICQQPQECEHRNSYAARKLENILKNPPWSSVAPVVNAFRRSQNQTLPSRSARNKAAVRSIGNASARIVGFTPLLTKAARRAVSS